MSAPRHEATGALRFCANLNFMFPDLPFLDRFEAAARAGFRGVEMNSPYEAPASAIRERLDANGLTQILINSPAGDRATGERGMACIPGKETAFRDSIASAVEYAQALNCRLVHLMAGVQPGSVTTEIATEQYIQSIEWACDFAKGTGIRFTIEAINHHDIPGYFLRTQEQAAQVVARFGRERVGLQFDVYHCQTSQGDVMRRLTAHIPIVAHMQIADVPHRNEPGTGEIGWENVFRHIESLGYRGWIGCEYRPKGDTRAGLVWREKFHA